MAPIAITPVTDEEVNAVYNFVYKAACDIGMQAVYVEHNLLRPLLNGPEEEKNNRIQTKMIRKLAAKGIITIAPADHGEGLNFTFSKSVVIPNKVGDKPKKAVPTVSVEERTPTSKDLDASTEFKNEFVEPYYYPDLVAALQVGGLNPIIVGPRGCGKSRALEEVMRAIGIKPIRIPLGIVRDSAELIGTKEVDEQNGASVTRFQFGLLTQARIDGDGVIFDEFDSVDPDLALGLHLALESGTKVTVQTEKGLQSFPCHPRSRIAATANTWGYGEGGINYAGTKIGNGATWDRFAPKIEADYDIKMEVQVLTNMGLHPDLIRKLYHPKDETGSPKGIILVIREKIKKKDYNGHLSFRAIENFAYYYQKFGWHKGMEYFIVNGFAPQYREKLRQTFRMQLGNDYVPSVNSHTQGGENYIPDMEKNIPLGMRINRP